MQRPRIQILNEIYAIVCGENILVMQNLMVKTFPKCRASLDKLTNDQLEKLIPLLKEAYTKENKNVE